MDDRTGHSRFGAGQTSDGGARRGTTFNEETSFSPPSVSEDAAYICDIDVTAAPLPSIGALGAVIRRASLTATAVHACELASSESRIRRQSWIGHGSEARA